MVGVLKENVSQRSLLIYYFFLLFTNSIASCDLDSLQAWKSHSLHSRCSYFTGSSVWPKTILHPLILIIQAPCSINLIFDDILNTYTLPGRNNHSYNLRDRRHDLVLATKRDSRNFIEKQYVFQ